MDKPAVKKYFRKMTTPIIEAIQFDGQLETANIIKEWAGNCVFICHEPELTLLIAIHEGSPHVNKVEKGQWIKRDSRESAFFIEDDRTFQSNVDEITTEGQQIFSPFYYDEFEKRVLEVVKKAQKEKLL
jgi:hypothetical protein